MKFLEWFVRSRLTFLHEQLFYRRLGGLDTLVFAGVVGENAPSVRACICEGLGFLGIELNESRRAETPAGVIPMKTNRPGFASFALDEELRIARLVVRPVR